MVMFVQGCTNASRKWGELVKAFIFLHPWTSTQSSKIPAPSQGHMAKSRATHKFLLFCHDKRTYKAMIIAFQKGWTVNSLDEVKMFFGML